MTIHDDFEGHLTRAQRWDARQWLKSTCVQCGRKAATKRHCAMHRDMDNAKRRDRYQGRSTD